MRITTTAVLLFSAAAFAPVAGAESGAAAQLLSTYKTEGAGPFDAARGQAMWIREGKPGRSCASCHGEDLTRSGEHVKTGKSIEPLAPSANPARLTERKKIRKWLYRNCKFTYGRECTPQEKGDFLTFISQQ